MKNNRIVFSFILIIFLVGKVPTMSSAEEPISAQTEHHLIVGTNEANVIYNIDPTQIIGSQTADVVYTISEGLFRYNVTTDEFENILATGYDYSDDGYTLTITLRQGVKFHDGTLFNATAVKWSIDRLHNIMENHTSPFTDQYYLDCSVFKTYQDNLDWAEEGEKIPIINHTEIVDEYTIKFHLNLKFEIRNLLSDGPSAILSPTAHAGDFNRTLEFEPLVTTAPFKFVSHSVAESETKLWAFEDYWGGSPYVTNLTFVYIDDYETRAAAFVNGEIDQINFVEPEEKNEWSERTDIAVYQSPLSRSYTFIAFVPENVNLTIRKALNYAYNYSMIIDLRYNEGETGERCGGVISKGMMYYNEEVPLPDTDLELARQTLIDEGVAPAEAATWTDEQWTTRADSDPLARVSFCDISENDIYQVLHESARLIGVDVYSDIRDVNEWINMVDYLENRRTLDTFSLIWGLGNIDPTLGLPANWHSEAGWLNWPMVNDSLIDQWVWDQVVETDPVEKQQIIDNIANRIQNELYSAIWIGQSKTYYGASSDWEFDQAHSRLWYFYREVGSGWKPYWALNNSGETDDTGTDDDGPGTISGFNLLSLAALTSIAVLYSYKRNKK